MPKRSKSRDTAKAAYIARKAAGEEVSLRELAQEQGVSYQTLRNWKAADKWDEALPKKRRGGQPGNRNSVGKKNAAGSHAAHRREIRTQKRTERTAPSFLICSRTQSGRSYSEHRWEAAPRWSMKCKS